MANCLSKTLLNLANALARREDARQRVSQRVQNETGGETEAVS